LVRRYERRIYAFVVQSCGRGPDAAEATQDVFVRAFRAIVQFDPRRTFAAWLFGIARHRCIDHHRAVLPEIAVEAPPDTADNGDPAELLARREEVQDLWRVARCHLPAMQFQALWLRYAEDMNLADIAQALGKTQTHVKVLLFRARQTLAARLPSPDALRSGNGKERDKGPVLSLSSRGPAKLDSGA
jgi:RNA polymerase sigma-70 factor (ECF subfamily)